MFLPDSSDSFVSPLPEAMVMSLPGGMTCVVVMLVLCKISVLDEPGLGTTTTYFSFHKGVADCADLTASGRGCHENRIYRRRLSSHTKHVYTNALDVQGILHRVTVSSW